ncbi:GGDEF domain-containing protein, partial [Klebsiella aerogenes]
ISIGMTPLVSGDIDSAIKRADSALYEAKNQGR